MDGILAGAISTGGMTNKYVGRIGDSACVGSGLYVNSFAAVCGSGQGENFVRGSICSEVCFAMKYGNHSLSSAVERVVQEMPSQSGGLVAVDAQGNVAMDFNCGGFIRAFEDAKGNSYVGTFKEAS